jgi:hypothetical protein
LYLGPSGPDRPFFEELGDVEINTQIYKILDHEADMNLKLALSPWEKGTPTPGLVYLGSLYVVCMILSSHRACDFMQGLGYAHSAPWGVNFLEDTVKWEANRA